MGAIEEAGRAKVPTNTAVTTFDSPPGYWEELHHKHRLRKKWLLTVPGQWWQAQQDARKEAVNALLRQLEGLDVWFDEGEVGLVSHDPDPDDLVECLDCNAQVTEDCMACALWPVISGG